MCLSVTFILVLCSVDITLILNVFIWSNNITNIYFLVSAFSALWSVMCNYILIVTSMLICLISDRYLNCVFALPILSCLFLVCIVRFITTAGNIIIYAVYSLIHFNICLCLCLLGCVFEKVYCWYLMFLLSLYIIIYCVLGILRVVWSLLILINLYIKIFILVSILFVCCDVWFSCEYMLINAFINVVVISIGADEFRYIYFVHSSVWISLCLIGCVYISVVLTVYIFCTCSFVFRRWFLHYRQLDSSTNYYLLFALFYEAAFLW